MGKGQGLAILAALCKGCPKQESAHAHTFGGDFEFPSRYLSNLRWALFDFHFAIQLTSQDDVMPLFS